MSLEDLRESIEEEMKEILSPEFEIEVTETTTVPSLDDSGITYPNLNTGVQKCKLIETCVLYIDLRKSTDLNLSHRRETMSKLYSTFLRSVMKASGYYDGKVRNIVGDRVMILFDSDRCYENAYRTAILLNSIVTKLLNKQFTHNVIKAGIGIDYGKMLVTKAGVIKTGFENTNYKSLVWLGRPANIASKLTDLANKTVVKENKYPKETIREHLKYPLTKNESWISYTAKEFFDKRLKRVNGPNFKHIDRYYNFHYVRQETIVNTQENTFKPILMTENVYNGVKTEAKDLKSVKEEWFREEKNIEVPGYSGKVFGVDSFFTAFD